VNIGLAYDLKDDVPAVQGEPDDAREEYDSLETVDSLAGALESLGHTVIRLGGGRAFLENVLRERVDLVFNIAEGRGTYRSREVQVPAVLEMLDIPYTGSDPECLAICLDKPLAKDMVERAGVLVPRGLCIAHPAELSAHDWSTFPLPAFVKPACEGSSKGICRGSRPDTVEALHREVLRLLALYRQPVLVEEFISGAELTVGIAGNPPEMLGVMQVMPCSGPDPDFFYSIEVKRDWQRLVRYICPATIPAAAAQRVARDSLKAFAVLGCRDVGRVDFRLDAQGQPFFIEANPLPGLKPGHSDLPMLAENMGIGFVDLIGRILESSCARYDLCLKKSA
jgi:D-alanine-D-alanine ligase